MPRYYFNLRNDISADDLDGSELSDLAAARAQAVWEARHLAAVSVKEHGRINLHHCIEVVDERGEKVLTVEFGDAVTIEG